jgi:hypothetical protein
MPIPKPVYQYDLDGNLLHAYYSINYAAQKTGLPFSCIRKAAAGDYGYSGDYVWSYERHTKIQPIFKSRYEKMRHRFKKIIATKGKRKLQFDSISEAANFIGCHRSAISQILNPDNNFRTIYGWEIQQV